uniref:Uncharacterized protein n=1 Tax=Trypanosoma congolense (strain IL3000) TaxID=1068625 RepID=G0UXA6_TRYCI|nr:conserved hypothetical protein [Trypanosoma congolense IL3000]
MLRRTPFSRWVPQYFRQPMRKTRGQRRGSSNTASAVREGNKVRFSSDDQQKATCDEDLRRRISSACETRKLDGNASSVDSPRFYRSPEIVALMKKACALLNKWHQLDTSLVNQEIRTKLRVPYTHPLYGVGEYPVEKLPNAISASGLSFACKTEVLGVFKTVLPPAPPQSSVLDCSNEASVQQPGRQTHVCDVTKRRLSVIPDDAASDALTYLRRIRGDCTEKWQDAPNNGTTLQSVGCAVLSLHDVVVLLQLYEAAESEDGVLLLQFMDQVRRVVLSSCRDGESGVAATCGGGVVAQLLLCFSSLGLMEESVLQQLINPRGPFLTKQQVRCYDVCDLVRLLVAFHRFGLHHEKCFAFVIGALRDKLLRKPLRSFSRQSLTLNQFSSTMKLPEEDTVAQCVRELTVNDLLESLTGISLSIHRERAVVDFLLSLIITTVRYEEKTVAGSHSVNLTDCAMRDQTTMNHKQKWVLARAFQVHRAAKISEQMELPQPALPHLLEYLAVRYRGIIVDGGDGEITPENVGFFDTVTADLVKVARSGYGVK